MIEFFRWLWSIGWSAGGLSVGTLILSVLALIILPRIFAALPEWVRNVLILIAVGAALHTIGYAKGRHDERVYYKAKINRQIGKAVQKGDDARAQTLQEFDDADDLPDDGFRRDD